MSVNHAYRLYHWRYLRQWCIHNSMNDFMKEHIRVTCLTGLNSLNYRLYSRHCHTPNEIRHLPVYQSRFNAIMYDKTRILAHGLPVRAMGRHGSHGTPGPRMHCHCCATCGSVLFWVIVLWRDLCVFPMCTYGVLLPIGERNELYTYRCERCALNSLIVGGKVFLNIPSNVKYTHLYRTRTT